MSITITDLTIAYDRHPAVHHLSGTFAAGSLTAIVGPNGAGKSTLLKSIVGLMRPSEGRIDLNGLKPRDIAYLPQQAEIDRSFPITVADTVALGHWRHVGIWRAITGAHWRTVTDALEKVGLKGFENRPIAQLSTGQFQRVLFARLLVQDAPVILLDEPFAAIDERTTADLMEIIAFWHGAGRIVVAVLHDIDEVKKHFPTALLMARELVAWGPTQDTLTDANFRRARAISDTWALRHKPDHHAHDHESAA
ncbi:MAG: zinc ABC transporter ATP-binding protein AztA [Parvibaculum sp.]|nr:zinc ABC transporter ATP-binding protein AztA [Parvibaculum sp.]